MLKTISAALVAASMIAAPAFAAKAPKTTTSAPVAKVDAAKPLAQSFGTPKSKVMNANAKLSHRKHVGHHRHHGAAKTAHAKTSHGKSAHAKTAHARAAHVTARHGSTAPKRS